VSPLGTKTLSKRSSAHSSPGHGDEDVFPCCNPAEDFSMSTEPISAHPRAETHISENQIGVSRVRRENLRSIDAIAGTSFTAVVFRSVTAEPASGSVMPTAITLSPDSAFPEFLLLRWRRAVFRQHADRPEVAGLPPRRRCAGRRRRRPRSRSTASISVPPWPPSAAATVDAEQALRCHQPGDVPGIAVAMRARVRAGGQVFLGKAAHRIAEHCSCSGVCRKSMVTPSARARPSTATTPSASRSAD